MKTINILLFGAFRKFVPTGKMQITIESEMSVLKFKELLKEKLESESSEFKNSQLIFESAVATDDQLLQDEDIATQYNELALLPPVCGG